ncbi:unnamed protein product [Symbiodinium microadriaticum]|nr:unnamed protein product [Symbiodinium microadriaticum]
MVPVLRHSVLITIIQIGLVDKPSGKLFWYNLKDDTSFWMSEAEQQRFQNLKAQGANREEKLEPSHIPVLSDGSSGKKKSARDIKLLMKSEQEARTASAHGVAPSIAPA